MGTAALILVGAIVGHSALLYWSIEVKRWNPFEAAFVAMITAVPILITLAAIARGFFVTKTEKPSISCAKP